MVFYTVIMGIIDLNVSRMLTGHVCSNLRGMVNQVEGS